jgi:hypothetical protein
LFRPCKFQFVGSGLALSDVLVISQVEGLKAQLARYLFLMPPYMAMPISYIATRYMLIPYILKNWH